MFLKLNKYIYMAVQNKIASIGQIAILGEWFPEERFSYVMRFIVEINFRILCGYGKIDK